MTDLVLTSAVEVASLSDLRPVHEAVRGQLVEEIGADRLDRLRAAVDGKTFTAALHWLSSADRPSVETKRRYAEDLTDFATWASAHFGVHPVPLLDVLDFDAVTVWTVYARSRGWAVRSQRRILAVISSLFRDAVPRGWARANPVSFKHHAPKVGTGNNGRPAGATRVLPPGDIGRMRAAAQTAEERLVFRLGYELGMRESEMVKLGAENIDRATECPILTFQRKGGQWRKKELADALVRDVDAVLDGRADGPILIDPRTGRPRNRHQIINITRRIARHGGVADPLGCTPHVLRAAAITALLTDGVPLVEVQSWAGHIHASTTQGYFERSQGMKRDAALSAVLAARLDQRVADLAT